MTPRQTRRRPVREISDAELARQLVSRLRRGRAHQLFLVVTGPEACTYVSIHATAPDGHVVIARATGEEPDDAIRNALANLERSTDDPNPAEEP